MSLFPFNKTLFGAITLGATETADLKIGSHGLGRMMTGGGNKNKRQAFDFYPTPHDATRAFLRAEERFIRLSGDAGDFWEPCGRGGAIADVAAEPEFGLVAVSTDIVADPAHGVAPLNLLDADVARSMAVITNPPFSLWRKMLIKLLLELRVEYVAFLLKASVMNSAASAKLAEEGIAPNGRWDISWRLDFTGGGAPTMDCSWFVWDMRHRSMRGGQLRRDGPVRPRFASLC